MYTWGVKKRCFCSQFIYSQHFVESTKGTSLHLNLKAYADLFSANIFPLNSLCCQFIWSLTQLNFHCVNQAFEVNGKRSLTFISILITTLVDYLQSVCLTQVSSLYFVGECSFVQRWTFWTGNCFWKNGISFEIETQHMVWYIVTKNEMTFEWKHYNIYRITNIVRETTKYYILVD